MPYKTRRDFVKQAALGSAVLLTMPTSRVLGANDRVRVGMIGVGGRGQDLLKQVLAIPNAQLVAIAETRPGRWRPAFKPSMITGACST